jgi:hypothetical protein
MSHPIHRRLLSEEILLLRRSTEGRRYAAAQRSGRVDCNPHQVDAVIFALGRVREGGCILADEVGLGKTIEAGLVIAQLCAEGASRVLLVTPKALLGQWREELFTLFGISAIEASLAASGLDGPGVFLISREMLNSEQGLARLEASGPFDLCVVDEAHEVFAGLHRRFDRAGRYLEDAPHAKIAGRLRTLLAGRTPVLLLTATPLSNSLAELWALVQYVDRSGTLLGDLSTFRELFCADDDRQLQAGQAGELQRRLQVVVRRTLRRQAQEFLHTPFVGRHARLFEYDMSPAERELYDDVTRYLLTPGLAAFSGRHRTLLLLGFHRRMASSHRALAASLERLRERLLRHQAGGDLDPMRDFALDLEELDEPAPDSGEGDGSEELASGDAAVAAELARVQSLIERLGRLETDGKAHALLDAMRVLTGEAAQGLSQGKLVIFTESLATQDYLRELLLESGLPDEEITLFRGQNGSARAEQALLRWQAEIGDALAPHQRPSTDVAMRLALVHEFRQRSRVFISTEAGAKGLNLQFCDTLINYDLPWNPQRIEQRIGRCHRYGQTRDVTVINFLARDNAAQRLTFEILSRKLELFGAVMDASDHVLYEPSGSARAAVFSALSSDFAGQLARIYESARSVAQIEAELLRLDGELGARRAELERVQARTAGLIEARLDATVRQAFRKLADELPGHLQDLDRDLERLVCDYLDSVRVSYRRVPSAAGWLLETDADAQLPEPLRAGLRIVLGGESPSALEDRLTLGHPLVRLAVDAARGATAQPFSVRVSGVELESLRGRRGRLRVEKLRYPGFEPVDRLLPVAVLESAGAGLPAAPLDAAATLSLLRGPLEPAAGLASGVSDAELEDAALEAAFLDEHEVSSAEQRSFARAMAQLERYVEDRALIQRRDRSRVLDALQKAREQIAAAPGADARSRAENVLTRAQRELEGIDAELERLESRQDEGYRRWREQAHDKRYAPPSRELILEAEFVVG